MPKVEVLVGPGAGRKRQVECLPFLPGLVIHTPTSDQKSGASVSTITHEGSGLAIVQVIPDELLAAAANALSYGTWTLSSEEIYKDPAHKELVRVVEDLMANHRKESDAQEERIAGDLPGGKKQPASGARWGYRRDIVTPEFLVEAKTTGSDKLSVKDGDLAFLKKQAYSDLKVPVYVVELRGAASEVALLPSNEISDGLPDTKKFLDRRKAKSFSITAEMANELEGGVAYFVALPSGYYTLMGYEQFLRFAKRGTK